MNPKKTLYAFVSLLLILGPAQISSAGSEPSSDRSTDQATTNSGAWKKIADEHDIDPLLLYSIALVEARRIWDDGLARPWPWVINSKKYGAQWFLTQQEAVNELERLVYQEGLTKVDVGMMQINYYWNGYLKPDLQELIDPFNNIQVGAMVFKEAMRASGNHIGKALGMYNSGKSRVTDYSERVLTIYANIKSKYGTKFAEGF